MNTDLTCNRSYLTASTVDYSSILAIEKISRYAIEKHIVYALQPSDSDNVTTSKSFCIRFDQITKWSCVYIKKERVHNSTGRSVNNFTSTMTKTIVQSIF